MLALQIEDIKDFMNKLLCTDLFDHFLLSTATITTYVTHTIDGHIHPDFFDSDTAEAEAAKQSEIAVFSQLRPICFQLMKGTRTPLSFKFVFQLSPENQSRTLAGSGSGFSADDVTGMFLHVKYQNRQLICTTGISYATFSLDKTLEQEWDRLITVFFKNKKIPFEVL
jgi:hypothetical protein